MSTKRSKKAKTNQQGEAPAERPNSSTWAGKLSPRMLGVGRACVACGSLSTKILSTKTHPHHVELRRRRYACSDCGLRFNLDGRHA